MNESVEHSMSIISLVLHASGVVQAVMAILLLFSITSWVIIFRRGVDLVRARRALESFEQRFWSGIDLNELYKSQPERPLGAAHVFHAGFREFNRQVTRLKEVGSIMGSVERGMRVALSREEARNGQHLSILAIISSRQSVASLRT